MIVSGSHARDRCNNKDSAISNSHKASAISNSHKDLAISNSNNGKVLVLSLKE